MRTAGAADAHTPTAIRGDMVNVLPMRALAVDLPADNPGQWPCAATTLHHAELAMMTLLSYVA